MLSFTYYKEKKNFLYPLLCRKPHGCITLIIYLDTNRKYTKNGIKRRKVFLVLLIPNAVDFKRGPGMDVTLNMEKWFL